MFATNRAHILSDRPLTDAETSKVRGIFAESNCANESMRNTFDDAYRGISPEGEYILSFDGGEPTIAAVIEY